MASEHFWEKRWQRYGARLRALQWKLQRRLADRVTVDTPQGRLTVYTADQIIGRQLYIHGEFESAWIEATLRFLRGSGRLPEKGRGTVVDIGANLGVISIGLLRQREFSRAIAIEPDPRNFALLEHNARQNQFSLEQYRPLACAASDRAGTLEFELSGDNFGDHRVRAVDPQGSSRAGHERFDESHRPTIRVPARPLDALLAELPPEMTDELALLWIDTQGHEAHVFQGGCNTFARGVPVACEIWPYGILRSGKTLEQFTATAQEFWSHYWVLRRNRTFVPYATSTLGLLFDELGRDGDFDNVIFTK